MIWLLRRICNDKLLKNEDIEARARMILFVELLMNRETHDEESITRTIRKIGTKIAKRKECLNKSYGDTQG